MPASTTASSCPKAQNALMGIRVSLCTPLTQPQCLNTARKNLTLSATGALPISMSKNPETNNPLDGLESVIEAQADLGFKEIPRVSAPDPGGRRVKKHKKDALAIIEKTVEQKSKGWLTTT